MTTIDKVQAVQAENSVEVPLEIINKGTGRETVAPANLTEAIKSVINDDHDKYTKAIKACELAINAAASENKATKPMLDWWDKVNAGQIETAEIVKKTKLLENLTKQT
jgi:hypothetical protein